MGGKKNSIVVVLMVVVLMVIVFFLSMREAQARENFRGMISTVTRSMPIEQIEGSKETCIQCHTKTTPMVVAQHKNSAHMKAGLNCADCHGSDHKDMPLVTGKKVCGKCHEQETREMLASKHAVSWDKMWNNARYTAIPEAMRWQGCARCHDIGSGFNDVKDVRCDYCHSTHEFSVKEAKHPAACTTCHMGPDHPQAEAFAASAHGKPDGPTCVSCHQVDGSHDVSRNIGIGGVSNGGVLADWTWVMDTQGKPKLKRPVVSDSQFQKARAGNLAICNKCHSMEFNQQWLNGADQIKMAVDQQLLQAQEIVEGLHQEGLLYPDPASRPANPVDGQKLVLGGNQLYAGTSKAEAIYFKMYKFAAAQGWKSAYHQDFQRAGTEGFGEMKKLMAELQSEADLLRKLGPVKNSGEAAINTGGPAPDKRPNYWLFGLGGLVTGSAIALIMHFRRRKKIAPFTGLFLLGLIGLSIFSIPSPALAWDKNPAAQSQCSSCHRDQAGQLKTGKHASLQCLDCHRSGAALDQVRKPETCGKCHNGAAGYEMETYTSSPHGVQYKIKGSDPWAPTCATCHMPRGMHNPRGQLAADNAGFKGMIGEICLGCHTTDHVLKFDQDKRAIYRQADDLAVELKQVKQDTTEKDLWKMAGSNRLTPEEQLLARRLIDELDTKIKAGIEEYAPKMKRGTAHVNPDYAHWYGNAYLNLTLTEAKGTARELEMLAAKTGYSSPENDSGQPSAKWLIPTIAAAVSAAAAGFVLTTFAVRRFK